MPGLWTLASGITERRINNQVSSSNSNHEVTASIHTGLRSSPQRALEASLQQLRQFFIDPGTSEHHKAAHSPCVRELKGMQAGGVRV